MAEPHDVPITRPETHEHIGVDVLIVGSGPVGLSAAIALRQAGIDVAVIDKRHARDTQTSRAVVIHARTLEVLETLGVTDRLLDVGHKATSFTVRDGSATLMCVNFEELPTNHRYMVMVPQWRTEQILEQRLTDLGETVRYGWNFTISHRFGDRVEAQVRDSHDRDHLIVAKLVIAADGAKSSVRESIGIPFMGRDYEGHYLLADVEMACDLDDSQLYTFLTPTATMVMAALPDNRWRILTDDVPGLTPTPRQLEDLIHTRTATTGHIESIAWTSRYQVAHRLADTFRHGRILLAGDAAHIHSPAGGQGMNTGIQDAVTLAEIATRALHDDDLDLLDAYADQRRRIARNVITATDRLTRLLTARNPAVRRLRNTVLLVLGRLPRFRHVMAMRMSQLAHASAATVTRQSR